MMSARVASALALVSLSVCFAQESIDPNASFPEDHFPAAEEASQPEANLIAPQETVSKHASKVNHQDWSEHASLEPFRFGSVTSKRVRMRTAAQLDAPVIRELDKGTPLKITGETNDFYAVIPPLPMKAYVFRTYVLDGKIEGDRVNVRLEPSAEAPILTQLSSGHPVNGKPSPANAKWLEIDLPSTTRFYISRDYVQIIDEKEFQQLASSFQSVQSTSSATISSATKAPASTLKQEELVNPVSEDSVVIHTPVKTTTLTEPVKPSKTEAKTEKIPLTPWQAKEQNLQNQWLLLHAPATAKDYQDSLAVSAKRLKGVLEPYVAPTDAPGNYLLRDGTKVVAIVYSSNVDLSTYTGQLLEVKAVERPNSSYAYPAFCILEVL